MKIRTCTIMPTPPDLPSTNRATASANKLWDPGTIRIAWLNGVEGGGLVGKIMNAAEQWLPHLRGKIGYSWNHHPHNAHVRISFHRDSGCWSYVGTDALNVPPNMPTMNFGWLHAHSQPEEITRVVTHEFGHMLGLLHEHQNPHAAIPWDHEACYIYYARTQKWTKAQVDANILNQPTNTISSEFDPASIMLYPIPPELLTDESRAIPWINSKISGEDAKLVQSLYKKR